MSKFIIIAIFGSLSILTGGTLALADDYYTILKGEFRNAESAVTEADFDRPGYPLSRICVELTQDRPMSETYIMINKYTRISEGQGPLLPKTTVTKIIYRPYNSDVFGGNMFDLISTEFSSLEVISHQDDGQGKVIGTVTIRKTGDNLVFEREYLVGEETKTSYGYCFHRETKRQ